MAGITTGKHTKGGTLLTNYIRYQLRKREKKLEFSFFWSFANSGRVTDEDGGYLPTLLYALHEPTSGSKQRGKEGALTLDILFTWRKHAVGVKE